MRELLLVLGKELRMLVRDKRLFLGVTILSLVAMPALMGLLGNIDRVVGAEDQPVGVLAVNPDFTLAVVVVGTPGLQLFEDRAMAGAAGRYIEVRREGDRYLIQMDGARSRLVSAARTLRLALEAERERLFQAALAERGLSVAELAPFDVELVDTSEGSGRSTRLLAALVPYLVVLLLVSNAIRAVYIAVGEKEHNTLASLLVSTAPRESIVLGKSLAIMAFALYASILLIVGLLGFAYLGFSFGEGMSGVSFSLAPSQSMLLFVLVASLALLIASLVMVLGTFARTQREAGIYTAPLVFLAIAMAVFALSSGEFGPGLYAVPILGNALAMKDVFLGSLAVGSLAAVLAGNLIPFGAFLGASVWMYHREDLLFRR
jgi:sodium transport system permease protein